MKVISNGQDQPPSPNGPLLFLPTIPINTSSSWFNYLSDSFSLIVGATVTNNVSVFGVQVTNMDAGPNLHINKLVANWNKSNGLLINYDFDAYNPTNTANSIQLQLHYLGESTGETIYPPPTSNPSSNTSTPSSTSSNGNTLTTTPGFELVMLTAVFVAVGLVSRRRRKQQ